MKLTNRGTVTILLAIGALILAGCTLPFAPTPTTAPPTEPPTTVAEATVTPVPTQTPVPIASPLPTSTPVPTATPFPPSPTPTATAAATSTPLPPSSTPTATATATATPQPTRSRPRPTATPEFTGKLVFQASLGGDLYLIDAGGSGGGPRRLTDGADPVWAPDGQQIAFVRWREPRGVWVIEADGGGERRVFDWSEARWPAWSPDGERILFSRQHGGRLDEVEKCFWRWCFTFPPHAYWRLGIVRLGDGDFREPPASNFALAPDWSPDGQRFVYSDEHGLRVQRAEEGDGDPYAASYLITHDSRDTSPVWSPDGRRVAFTRRQHDHWEVYVVDADGRNLRRLTDTPEQPDGSLGNSASPAWSPDGKHLAFLTDRRGRWEIWVMAAPDGTGAGGRDQRPMLKDALDGLTLEYAGLGDRAISWTR